MNLTSITTIKAVLKQHQARPSKRLGQNFLIDQGVVKKMADAAELTAGDTVLEIGPGLGALTLELSKRVQKIIAVEKDPKMAEILLDTVKDCQNIEVIQGDILKVANARFSTADIKVIGNLPFYLTNHLIRKLLESPVNQPSLMVFITQKEVGQRICAKPPNMNLLAVSVQFFAKPEIISLISKKSFWPQPKINAAIIRIIPSQQNAKTNPQIFFKIAKAGFSQPRKQILNNLTKRLKLDKETAKIWLLQNKINPERRAETLTIQEWIDLAESYTE